MLAVMQEQSSYERPDPRADHPPGARDAAPTPISERLYRNQFGIILAVALTVAAAAVLL